MLPLQTQWHLYFISISGVLWHFVLARPGARSPAERPRWCTNSPAAPLPTPGRQALVSYILSPPDGTVYLYVSTLRATTSIREWTSSAAPALSLQRPPSSPDSAASIDSDLCRLRFQNGIVSCSRKRSSQSFMVVFHIGSMLHYRQLWLSVSQTLLRAGEPIAIAQWPLMDPKSGKWGIPCFLCKWVVDWVILGTILMVRLTSRRSVAVAAVVF